MNGKTPGEWECNCHEAQNDNSHLVNFKSDLDVIFLNFTSGETDSDWTKGSLVSYDPVDMFGHNVFSGYVMFEQIGPSVIYSKPLVGGNRFKRLRGVS